MTPEQLDVCIKAKVSLDSAKAQVDRMRNADLMTIQFIQNGYPRAAVLTPHTKKAIQLLVEADLLAQLADAQSIFEAIPVGTASN